MEEKHTILENELDRHQKEKQKIMAYEQLCSLDTSVKRMTVCIGSCSCKCKERGKCVGNTFIFRFFLGGNGHDLIEILQHGCRARQHGCQVCNLTLEFAAMRFEHLLSSLRVGGRIQKRGDGSQCSGCSNGRRRFLLLVIFDQWRHLVGRKRRRRQARQRDRRQRSRFLDVVVIVARIQQTSNVGRFTACRLHRRRRKLRGNMLLESIGLNSVQWRHVFGDSIVVVWWQANVGQEWADRDFSREKRQLNTLAGTNVGVVDLALASFAAVAIIR